MATEVYVPSWGTKDPDDVEYKYFDAAGRLAKLGNPAIASVEVFLDEEHSDDDALVIEGIAWLSETKRIRFKWSGGTLAAAGLPRTKYRITARWTLSDSRQFDQSADVEIDHH
ncbi:MAG TPA: hypothetical protein VJN18_32720 [Polyangiaceae bacterium]|nr:hypothetical protein [Polyangiaceae bacterium]